MTGTIANRLAVAGLAAALALAFSPGASAAPKEKAELAPPAASPMDDAKGKVEAKEKETRRTLKVEAKHLEPGRRYEVRRRGESAPIGDFTTNRRGKGKTKIVEDTPAPQALRAEYGLRDGNPSDGGGNHDDPTGGDGTGCRDDYPYGDGDCGGDDGGNGDPGGGGWGYGYYYYYYYYYYYPCPDEPRDEPCAWYCVQIVDEETGEVVLECDGEEHEDDGECEFPVLEDFEIGYADYCGEDGSFGSVVMQRYDYEGEAYDQFYFSFATPREMEDCEGWYEWRFYEVSADQETGLPLGVGSVRDLAGRAFEIRGADEATVIAGELPHLESLGDIPLWYGPTGGGDGTEGDGDHGLWEGFPDFTLWIADDEGELVKAAVFQEIDLGDPWIPYEGGGANGLPGAAR